jgi:VanZ family protein
MEKAGLWSLVIIYSIIVFYAVASPKDALPPLDIQLSILHIPLFFGVAYLLFNALVAEDFDVGPTFVIAYLTAVVYGIFTEIAQIYVPGRFFSYTDIQLNILGAALVVFSFEVNLIFEIANDYVSGIIKK